jgi:hypothetical protein
MNVNFFGRYLATKNYFRELLATFKEKNQNFSKMAQGCIRSRFSLLKIPKNIMHVYLSIQSLKKYQSVSEITTVFNIDV